MNNASGLPTDNHPVLQLVSQRTWRKIGVVALLLAGLFAWYAPAQLEGERSVVFLCGYFGLFTVFLLAAFYAVILDIQYIRLQYVLAQREVFNETLGSEAFRNEIRQAHAKKTAHEQKPSEQ